VKELSSVSILTYTVSSNRILFLRIALIALAGLGSNLVAQTAPQLLPYTAKLVAGGGTTAIAAGAKCPVSPNTSTDAYGDGCLATEVQLSSPRFAAVDVSGNVFFSDYTSGLIRRVDAVSGIVTAVAGGATVSPAAAASCGAYTSADAKGDGCLGTAVKLSHPTGLVFSPLVPVPGQTGQYSGGDLYFGDSGYANVRKIAATNGLITTSGIISLVDGNAAGTYGYTSDNSSGNIVAATSGYLDSPYGLAFDNSGNLYIAEEYKEAILVVNTSSVTTTVTGVSIAPGTVAKIVGAPSGGGSVCPNGTASPFGCNYGLFSNSASSGSLANTSEVDAPYGVAVDAVGNVYFANEYEDNVGLVTPAGIISNYAGIQGTPAKVLTRGAAGSFAIGSDFGIAADANSNVYVTDASSGVIWRIDGAGQSMYVVAGGAATACSSATDSYGDGCPAATGATLGNSALSTGSNYASTTAPGPGVFGVSVDPYSDLFFGDTETNLIREIASGTQFGKVGVNATTQIADIHFAAGDSPAASAYSITAGAAYFSLGTATCTPNSDKTEDCLLPIIAAPVGVATGSVFQGTLQVLSSLGGKGTFLLSGTYFGSPTTTTSVVVTPSCAGSTVFLPTTAVTLTATVNSSGSPTGTVTFFANGTAIGTPQTVTNGVATLSYTFATPGNYVITATYSGDSYFTTSTGQSANAVSSQTANFNLSLASYPSGTVYPGGTALFGFNLAQNLYAGTISFTVSGLPPNSTYTMSPTSITSTACSAGNTVALSILTQQGSAVLPSSLGADGGGWASLLSILTGAGLAWMIGLRRRRATMRYGRIWVALALLFAAASLVACNSNVQTPAGTPAGPYTVTVTATGSAGGTVTLKLPTFTVY
jgi:hypothetical protein